MVALDQLRILSQNLLQSDRCHIFMTLSAEIQRIIILSDRLVNCLKFIGICLKFIDIFRRQVSGRLQILADHPFTERRHNLTGFKIHQTQKISCLNIMLIIHKTLFQTIDRT